MVLPPPLCIHSRIKTFNKKNKYQAEKKQQTSWTQDISVNSGFKSHNATTCVTGCLDFHNGSGQSALFQRSCHLARCYQKLYQLLNQYLLRLSCPDAMNLTFYGCS